ncbi:MAG: type IV pilus modification protein PilV, partial [Steroidobacteraceae bacterium]
IPRQAAFSLVEVMVALVVLSVGLLGIAKMQALALSSTGTSKMRSLAAIEAASLASTLHADRAYWANIAASLTVSVDATGAITAGDTTLQTAPTGGCTSASTPCSSAQIAAQDLSDWVTSLTGILPGSTATVQCDVDSTKANPVSCSIDLQWTENLVALNTATNTAATATQTATALQNAAKTEYTLYVEP